MKTGELKKQIKSKKFIMIVIIIYFLIIKTQYYDLYIFKQKHSF